MKKGIIPSGYGRKASSAASNETPQSYPRRIFSTTKGEAIGRSCCGAKTTFLAGKTNFARVADLRHAHGCARRKKRTFLKKTVDPKNETAINTAPQVRGPSKAVFDEKTASEEIRKKLLTAPKT